MKNIQKQIGFENKKSFLIKTHLGYEKYFTHLYNFFAMANKVIRFLGALSGAFIIRETHLKGEMRTFRKTRRERGFFRPGRDKENLRRDMRKIRGDVEKAIKEYDHNHG